VPKETQNTTSLTALQKAYLKLEELQARLDAAERTQREPIAIVGMACRLPGGVRSPEEYWALLAEGRDAVTEVPRERWDIDAYYDPDPEAPGKMYTRWGGFLSEVDLFDAAFFGISPREAVSMDPQQRILLEVTWEALENAGIPPESLAGSRSGVFTGIGFNDYGRLLAAQDAREVSAYSGSGIQLCFATGRVSYVLGLRGPSLAIDTACSSSLVALHEACQSLRGGECDLALAGGVNLLLAPEGNIFLSRAGALSPDGRCKTFDAAANGMVRGDGCGVVVLKRLGSAVADGNAVLGVIRGSAVNHDGRSSGLTVPSGTAQEAVLRQALKNAGIEPQDVSYVEAHGTGTPLGDPIEMQSTGAVYGRRGPGVGPLVVGAVKTNLGHLEAASGVTSVIKVALMLGHGRIPRHLHFRTWNPHIALEGMQVRVPTEMSPWLVEVGRPRRAGVSSFGLSGTNAHVILEEAPEGQAVAEQAAEPLELLALSARKPAALAALGHSYAALLSGPGAELPQICRAAAVGRSHHDHRLVVLARSAAQAATQLATHLDGAAAPDIVTGRRPLDGPPKLVLVFSGQGAQWPRMGCELMAREAVFREALEECAALVRAETGRSLIDELSADGAASRLEETEVAQPALFALQVALVALWRSWGIEPDAVVGHSVGEIAAAHVAGALDLSDAVRLVCLRGQLLQRATGKGRMAAVGLSYERALERLAGVEGRVAVAAVNGPVSVVLSGEADALDAVLEPLRRGKIFCRPLAVNYAFHSPQTTSLGPELTERLNGLAPRTGRTPMISTVTGRAIEGPSLDGSYWGRNMTGTVHFARAVQELVASGHDLFLEISPHPVLTAPLRETLEAAGRHGAALPSLRRGAHERSTMLESLATLYARGCPAEWRRVYPQKGPLAAIPTYPWQRQRFWIDVKPSHASGAEAEKPEGVEDWLYTLDWRVSPAQPAVDTKPGLWLILADERGVGARLADKLTKAGHSVELLRAADLPLPASREADLSGGLFKAAVERLMTAQCRAVVHLWSLDGTAPEAATLSSLMADQELGARSAVALIQALMASPGVRPALWLVTRGVHPVGGRQGRVAASQAPLWAIGRTCAAEHPDLWGGLADLDPDSTLDEAAAHLLEAVLAQDREDQVAYGGGQRHIARLVRRPPQDREPLRVRADARYLITGGLEGIGLEVARWLAQKGARHLVLVGRTRMPPRETWDSGDVSPSVARRIQAIRALEDAGVTVECPAVDVADAAQVEALRVSLAASGRKRIAGVVHAASVWRGPDGSSLVTPLSSTRPDSFDAVLPPKVVGSWLLQSLVDAGEPPDFVVFFSSGAALVGSAGQGNYAAANAFMDAFAHDWARRSGTRVLAVNWGPIADVGFGATEEGRAVFGLWGRRGIMAISPAQLVEALEILIPQDDCVQAGVMRTDWRLLQRAYEEMLDAPWASCLVERRASRARLDVVKLLEDAAPEERHERLASHIQGLVVAVMGFGEAEAPELSQGLFDLGMDSLLALELKNRIQTSLRREIPAAALFEHPTIESLAHYLLQDVLGLAEGARGATAAVGAERDVLADIESLSEEEVEKRLAEKLARGTA
jgi:acyl transferase domain-containing protein